MLNLKLILLLFFGFFYSASANAAALNSPTSAYSCSGKSNYVKLRRANGFKVYKCPRQYLTPNEFFTWVSCSEVPSNTACGTGVPLCVSGCKSDGKPRTPGLPGKMNPVKQIGSIGHIYLPPNSHKHGNGWRCNNGYKRVQNQCNPVRNLTSPKPRIITTIPKPRVFIPPNAYAHGSSWKCKNGYKRVQNQCNPIPKPKNNVTEKNVSVR